MLVLYRGASIFPGDTTVVCEDRQFGVMGLDSRDLGLVAPLALSTRLEFAALSEALSKAFPYYARFVLDYSRKQLSYQSDIINAFTGITRMLEQCCGWRFLEALPVPLIDLALL
jgi:hypothetical protein